METHVNAPIVKKEEFCSYHLYCQYLLLEGARTITVWEKREQDKEYCVEESRNKLGYIMAWLWGYWENMSYFNGRC